VSRATSLLGKKEEMIAGGAGKTKPPPSPSPLAQGLDPPVIC